MAGLIEKAKAHLAVRKFRRSVLGEALAQQTQRYFYSGDTLSWMDQASKEHIVQDFFGKLAVTSQSPNAVIELRTHLVNYTIACCKLNVLAIRPEEKEEQHYAANPYISGELRQHIVKAAPHNEEMAQLLWQHDGDLSADELLTFANTRSALMLYYVNGFNMARIDMGDSDDAKDWFKPFYEAMMVCEEDLVREMLDLPRLLPPPLHGLAYNAFMNFIVNGDRNPFFTWTQKFPAYYLAGEGPLPSKE